MAHSSPATAVDINVESKKTPLFQAIRLCGLPPLAVSAERGGSSVENDRLQWLCTRHAWFAASAVGEELVLVLALFSFGVDVVAQCRAAVVDPRFQYRFDRLGQGIAALTADATCPRVNPCEEQRLVRVNVANPRNGSLAEQLGLDRPRARLYCGVEARPVEFVAERLWSHVVKRGNVAVVTGIDDPEPSEAAGVVKHEMAVVGECPHRSGVWSVVGATWFSPSRNVDNAKGSGHAKMRYQLSVVVEVEEQILASPANSRDRRPSSVEGRRELVTAVAIDGLDRRSGQ